MQCKSSAALHDLLMDFLSVVGCVVRLATTLCMLLIDSSAVCLLLNMVKVLTVGTTPALAASQVQTGVLSSNVDNALHATSALHSSLCNTYPMHCINVPVTLTHGDASPLFTRPGGQGNTAVWPLLLHRHLPLRFTRQLPDSQHGSRLQGPRHSTAP